MICVEVDSDAGMSGNPTLHVGGEHDAVIVDEPGLAPVTVHD